MPICIITRTYTKIWSEQIQEKLTRLHFKVTFTANTYFSRYWFRSY